MHVLQVVLVVLPPPEGYWLVGQVEHAPALCALYLLSALHAGGVAAESADEMKGGEKSSGFVAATTTATNASSGLHQQAGQAQKQQTCTTKSSIDLF